MFSIVVSLYKLVVVCSNSGYSHFLVLVNIPFGRLCDCISLKIVLLSQTCGYWKFLRHVSITAVATIATDAVSAPPAVATGGFLWFC